MKYLLITFISLIVFITHIHAQENYEIQVYASEITPTHTTMIELHSNASPKGPDNDLNYSHPLHETVEITNGIARNFEIGFYFFNRINNGSFQYSGSHIRPRITVPESWGWKLGASLSTEAGFIKDPATNSTQWDYEIRPIIDQNIGNHYYSINPAIDGNFTTKEISFSPNIKYSYKLNKVVALGIEYYGVFGSPFNQAKNNEQTHQFHAVTDLDIIKDYEFNFGIGHGITPGSDQWNIKLILGKKIAWKKSKTK